LTSASRFVVADHRSDYFDSDWKSAGSEAGWNGCTRSSQVGRSPTSSHLPCRRHTL